MRLSIMDQNENHYELGASLGAGGQGAVYAIQNMPQFVAKVMRNPKTNDVDENPETYATYEKMMAKVMAIDAIDHLATPVCMLKAPLCGYLMRCMEGMESLKKSMVIPRATKEKTVTLADVFTESGGLKKRLEVLKNLAKVLLDLYNQGLVYCDLSPANIFIAEDRGKSDVWLIDLDNLSYAGQVTRSNGTPMYRAPEVVFGACNTFQSDWYSFALLAFEYLTFSKPFAGALMEGAEDSWDDDEDTSFELQAEEGTVPYMYGTPNGGNHPIKGCGIPLERVSTEAMRTLFAKTFSPQAQKNPHLRPTIGEWHGALSQACDQLLPCAEGHWFLGQTCIACETHLRPQGGIQYFSGIYQPLRYEEEQLVVGAPRHFRQGCSKPLAFYRRWLSPRVAGEFGDFPAVNFAVSGDVCRPSVLESGVEVHPLKRPRGHWFVIGKNKKPVMLVGFEKGMEFHGI